MVPKKKHSKASGWVCQEQTNYVSMPKMSVHLYKHPAVDSSGGLGGWWLISQVGWNPRNMEGPTPTPWQKTKALPDLGGFCRPNKGVAPMEAPWECLFHRKRNGKSILSDLILCQNKTWSVSYHTIIQQYQFKICVISYIYQGMKMKNTTRISFVS